MKTNKEYANHRGWTDVNPFEVLTTTPSGKTKTIQAMDSERKESYKPEFIAGGFAGHCVNQADQEWNITSNKNGLTLKIRLGKKGWKDKGGARYSIEDKPVKYYDYNF